MTNYKRTVVWGSVIAGASAVLAGLLGYVLRLFLTRQVTVEEYGLIYAVIAFFSFLNVFYYFGLNQALAKVIPDLNVSNQHEKTIKALVSSLVIQAAVALPIAIAIIMFRTSLSTNFFNSPLAETMLIVGSVYLLLSPLNLIQAAFRGLHKIWWYAAFDIARAIAYLFGTVLLFSLLSEGYQINSLILSYALFYLLVLALFLGYILVKRINIFRMIDISLSKKLLAFGIPLVLSSSVGVAFGKIDVLFLTYFSGLTNVAYYNIAVPTVKALWSLASVFVVMLLPVFSELWSRGQTDILSAGIARIVKYALIITLPATIAIMLYSALIIQTLFGEQFMAASRALILFAPALVFMTLEKPFGSLILAMGKTKATVAFTAIGFGVNILGNIVLIPPFGVVGAVISAIVSFAVFVLLEILYVRKSIYLTFPRHEFLKEGIAVAVFVLAILLLRNLITLSPLPEAIIVLSSAGALYTVLLFFLNLITVSEMTNLLKIK